MDKNIVTLLNNNLRVIIPDLGAFIIKQKEPKIVVFNEFLKYDDGLLIEFMVKAEGIEKEMAWQQLSDYTGNASKVLEAGDIFTIKGVGTLQKERSGKIEFTAEKEISTRDTSHRAKEESLIQLDEKKSVAKPKAKHAAKTVSKATPNTAEPAKSLTQEDVKIPAEVKAPVKTPSPVISSVEMSKPVGYRSNKTIKWILIILLSNMLVIAFFAFKDNIRGLFRSKNEPVVIADSLFDQLSDSVRAAVADTTLVFREDSLVTAMEDNNPTVGNLRYYIVAGCFSDKINADELVKSLKAMGFKAEMFGKIGNLYAVSFVSFDDKELAIKELKRIREENYPEAWMTRF
jgi:hypothetical protein